LGLLQFETILRIFLFRSSILGMLSLDKKRKKGILKKEDGEDTANLKKHRGEKGASELLSFDSVPVITGHSQI